MVSAAVVSAALAAFQPWKSQSSETVSVERPVETLRTVEVANPSATSTSSVVLPATVRPWQATDLIARVSGYLKVWHRDLGDRVQAGELLAEIDTRELDQELAAAESLAREADAAAVQARAERVEAEADLKVADSQLERARAELALARSQLTRREKLFASKIVTQEEFDTFQRQLEARVADEGATASDVSRRRSNLDTRTAIIAVRDATAKSRQSTVNRLQELVVFKKIVAPFDGVVTRRNAEIGALITAGKEVLFTMEDMSRIRVTLNVPQTYSVQTTIGVEATIILPEAPGKSVKAAITRVADSVESTTRTMLAEIELENSQARLQPGSYAQVSLKTQQDSAVWSIPSNTVSMRVQGPHIAVVNEQDQIELRQVSLGRDLGKRVIVAEGLHGGERLVINPADDLVNGQQVAVGTK